MMRTFFCMREDADCSAAIHGYPQSLVQGLFWAGRYKLREGHRKKARYSKQQIQQ